METDKTSEDAGRTMSGMRRKEKEITEKAIIEEIFRQNDVGRLGLVNGDEPYIVPMNFAYMTDRIYIHSHQDGTKMRLIKKQPRVCFEVDDGEIITGENPCDFSWRYKSAIAYGEARIIESDEERHNALRFISDKYSFGKGKLITPELMKKFKHLLLIEIKVDKMTGKQSPATKKD